MQVIIVDDEPKAIELIKGYLQHFSQLHLVATFRNSLKALEFLNREHVDLVFLDIDMPHLSGISLSKMIDSKTRVIFTTAYPQFAAESYEVDAVDYLLKPIPLERFTKAVSKILSPKKEVAGNRALVVKSGSKIFRVEPESVLYLEKDGNYMIYHLHAKKIMARETVSEALALLPDYFIQIHKSYIVNTRKIEFYQKEELSLGGKTLPVGGSFREKVLRGLGY